MTIADPFLCQLADVCRRNTTRAKWVIVPSYAVGHMLGERLVLEGTSWANLRFTPPLDIALQMAAPFLLEAGFDPAPDELGPALITRLLLDLPPGTPRYFGDLAEHPNMVKALWGTLREIRMAELGAADLARAKFASREKAGELVALLAAYEAHLRERRLADGAAVYQEALRHLDVGPVLGADLVVELPDVVWSPLERRFLHALPGEHLAPRALEVPDLTRPRRIAGPCERIAPDASTDARRLAFLMNPAAAPPAFGDGTVELFKAGGREAEIEEVLRRIFRAGVALDHVEVVCPAAADAVLVWEKAQRHGLPITVGAGVPIMLTRPARALLSFCDWVEQGLPAGGLRRLLQSGDVRLDVADGPTAGQAARLLARSAATWGRATYAPAMRALAAWYRERAADTENEELKSRSLDDAGRSERVAAWIARLLELVPEGRDGLVGLDRVLDGCSCFVDRVAAKASELDGEACVAVRDALSGLRLLGALERPRREALELVRHHVEGITVGRDRARPGHLFVTTLTHAGRSGRPRSFVIGLEEGRVLPAPLEDAVLLDDERASLGPELPTSGDRIGEALYAVVSRLASLGGRVCLSFSSRDLREHRETFPSWLLLQAARIREPGRDWTYEDLHRALGEPASMVPATSSLALSDAGWWLAQLKGIGPGAGIPPVHAAFPWLADGERAEAERDSDRFTIYDGLVRAAGRTLDPRVNGRPVSPTTLEKLAGCPFRHFLQYGLRLNAVEESAPDPDRWLDPLTRGSLLHDLYAAILREIRQNGQTPDPTRHFDRLKVLAIAALDELRAEMPPPSEHVLERERQEILDDLELFLRLEADGRREPIGLEVSFGGGDSDGEPLAQSEPVTLDLGGGLAFRLRGRIDRIDRLPDATYEVVDYKTGFYRATDFVGTFRGGRMLQHALYAQAAAQLLRKRDAGARVSRSGYYLPTARGGGQRIVCPPVRPADVAAVVGDLFDVLATGAFTQTPEKDDCKWCLFGAACGSRPRERAALKVANDANSVLAPYRRLSERA